MVDIFLCDSIYMNIKPVIAVFDFDGTITNKDTFLEFIRYTKGNLFFLYGFFLHLPLLIAYILKIYPNWKIKQKLFSYFFKGMKLKYFNLICEEFCHNTFGIIRSEAKNAIQKHIDANDTLVIISASINNWVRPFADKLTIPIVLCTEIEIDLNDCLTGKFSTPNCYGQEKVNRLLQIFPQRDNYYLIAYGDSSGDKELMNYADENFYKKF